MTHRALSSFALISKNATLLFLKIASECNVTEIKIGSMQAHDEPRAGHVSYWLRSGVYSYLSSLGHCAGERHTHLKHISAYTLPNLIL